MTNRPAPGKIHGDKKALSVSVTFMDAKRSDKWNMLCQLLYCLACFWHKWKREWWERMDFISKFPLNVWKLWTPWCTWDLKIFLAFSMRNIAINLTAFILISIINSSLTLLHSTLSRRIAHNNAKMINGQGATKNETEVPSRRHIFVRPCWDFSEMGI